jgi:hypothetical protein
LLQTSCCKTDCSTNNLSSIPHIQFSFSYSRMHFKSYSLSGMERLLQSENTIWIERNCERNWIQKNRQTEGACSFHFFS